MNLRAAVAGLILGAGALVGAAFSLWQTAATPSSVERSIDACIAQDLTGSLSDAEYRTLRRRQRAAENDRIRGLKLLDEDPASAIPLLQQAARHHDREALLALARSHAEGRGIAKNPVAAVDLVFRAGTISVVEPGQLRALLTPDLLAASPGKFEDALFSYLSQVAGSDVDLAKLQASIRPDVTHAVAAYLADFPTMDRFGKKYIDPQQALVDHREARAIAGHPTVAVRQGPKLIVRRLDGRNIVFEDGDGTQAGRSRERRFTFTGYSPAINIVWVSLMQGYDDFSELAIDLSSGEVWAAPGAKASADGKFTVETDRNIWFAPAWPGYTVIRSLAAGKPVVVEIGRGFDLIEWIDERTVKLATLPIDRRQMGTANADCYRYTLFATLRLSDGIWHPEGDGFTLSRLAAPNPERQIIRLPLDSSGNSFFPWPKD